MVKFSKKQRQFLNNCSRSELDVLGERLRTEHIEKKRKNGWEDKDLQYLRENYQLETNKRLSAKLGKTPMAVQAMANKIGLKKNYRLDLGEESRTWTVEEDVWIKKHRDISPAGMAKHFEISEKDMKIHLARTAAKIKHTWTFEEDEYIINNRFKKPLILAEHFGVSPSAIHMRKRHLGLTKASAHKLDDESDLVMRGSLADWIKTQKEERDKLEMTRLQQIRQLKTKICIGDCFKVNKCNYKIIEKYPHIVRAQRTDCKNCLTECFNYIDLENRIA